MEKYSHRLPKMTSKWVEYECLIELCLIKLTLIPQLCYSYTHILHLS